MPNQMMNFVSFFFNYYYSGILGLDHKCSIPFGHALLVVSVCTRKRCNLGKWT